MVTTRENDRGVKDANGGMKESMGNRENRNLSKSSQMAATPYRRGVTSSWSHEPFRRMREEFDRMFDQVMGGWPALSDVAGRQSHWGCDVQEDDGSIIVRAEAPGFEPDNFHLEVRGDQLVMHASHKSESEEKQRGFHAWQQQEFYRTINLPPGADQDHVEATYRNGILTVTIAKSDEAKGRRITVKG